MPKKFFQKNTKIVFISFLFLCFLFIQHSFCMDWAKEEYEAENVISSHVRCCKIWDEANRGTTGMWYDDYPGVYNLPQYKGEKHYRVQGVWETKNFNIDTFRDLLSRRDGMMMILCPACYEASKCKQNAKWKREEAALKLKTQAELALLQQQQQQQAALASSSPQNNTSPTSGVSAGGSGNNLLSTIKSLKSTITKNEEEIKKLKEESDQFTTYKANTIQELEALKKDKEDLSLMNVSLQKKHLEKKEKIKKLNEEKEAFKKFEEKITQEKDEWNKEKDDLLLSINSIKQEKIDKEKEIDSLTEERNKLYALTAESDKTTELIKQMMEVIGINTADLNCTGNVFAQQCLDLLKNEMGSI